MTQLINAYANGAGTSLADSMKSLADNMFGNEARQTLIRESAIKGRRQNDAAERAAQAYRDNNQVELGAQALRNNPDFTGMGAQNLARQAIVPGMRPDSMELQVRQIGAGHPAGSTFMGERENIAQRAAAATEATNRAAQTQEAIANRQIQQQQWADEHTLVNLRAPDGRIMMVPKSQVAGLQAHGYDVVPTLDNVKAGILAPPVAPTQTAGATPGVPSAAAPMPTAGMNPDKRALLGLPTAVQNYIHPQTGQTATSQDNGQTITTPDGKTFPLVGSGFQPSSAESNIAMTRDNMVRDSAAEPEPPVAATPAAGAAASDAATTTGIAPFVQKHANATIGAIPGAPAALNAVTGSPQIGAATEAARSAQELRNNFIRATIMGMPGRPSNYAQHMVDRLLPQGAVLENPATEAQHVGQIVQQLRTDRAEVAQLARNPNTLPADRIKLVAHMRQIDQAIRMMASPAGAQAPATEPAQGPPAQRVIGQTYPTPKGPMIWMADGWHPAQ